VFDEERFEKIRGLQQQLMELTTAIEGGELDRSTATNRIWRIREQMDQLTQEKK
jgi:hypothetical protein